MPLGFPFFSLFLLFIYPLSEAEAVLSPTSALPLEAGGNCGSRPSRRCLVFICAWRLVRRGSCDPPQARGETRPAARMQQNGSSGSNGSDGGGSSSRERQALSFSPLPAATTRVRRFIQERRTLPLPKVMVVFSAAGDAEKPGDAAGGSDCAEDELRKPAAPAPRPAPGKPLCSAPSGQEQEVGRLPTHLQLLSGGFRPAHGQR